MRGTSRPRSQLVPASSHRALTFSSCPDLLLVQLCEVCVLSDTRLQTHGPERDRRLPGLKMNMHGMSPFSKLTP